MSATATQRRSAAIWGGAFLASSGALAGLAFSEAIDRSTTLILALIPVALMIAFYRAAQRANTTPGSAGSAQARYTRGILMSSLAYMLGLGIALSVWRNYDVSQAATFLLALMPVLPIFGMIWVMARYLHEERDEYLRHRAIMASLGGLAAVLAIGSFWGFLETFELVPHVPGWWAVPIWAVGMGVTQCIWSIRDSGRGS
jgi:hypothetical protein